MASLLGGAAVAWQQARIAEKRSRDAQRLANSLVFELHDAIADLPGATKPRALLLKRASEMLDTLAAETPDDPALAEELAAAHHRLANVLGTRTEANLGDQPAALAAHRKGLAIRERLAADSPGDASRQEHLASSYIEMASTLQGPEAVEQARRTLAIAERLLALEPGSEAYRRLLARALYAEGSFLVASGNVPAARTSFEKALAAFEAVLATAAEDASIRRSLTMAHKRLAAILSKQREFSAAFEHYRKVLAWDQARVAQSPESVEARYDLSVSLVDYGVALAASGDGASADEQWRRALETREALVRADPGNVRARNGLASLLSRLGDACGLGGRHGQALAYLQRAEDALGPKTANRDLLASICWTRSRSYEALGQWDRALDQAQAALELGLATLAAEPTNNWSLTRVAWQQLRLADVLLGMASQPQRAATARASARTEAGAAYRETLRLATELQGRGALVGSDLKLLDQARAGLDRCAQQLAK